MSLPALAASTPAYPLKCFARPSSSSCPLSAQASLLTLVFLRHYSPATFWLLPGLWQLVFSLGVFASCRFLPRPMLAAGVWYLGCSLICLSFGNARALSPWTMGLSFGLGQLLIAAILFLTSEPADDES